MYRFLENIIEIQGYQECKIAKIEAGEKPDPPKRIYRDLEARLKRLVDGYQTNFEDNELMRYVRSIASVLKFDITIRKKLGQNQEQVDDMQWDGTKYESID